MDTLKVIHNNNIFSPHRGHLTDVPGIYSKGIVAILLMISNTNAYAQNHTTSPNYQIDNQNKIKAIVGYHAGSNIDPNTVLNQTTQALQELYYNSGLITTLDAPLPFQVSIIPIELPEITASSPYSRIAEVAQDLHASASVREIADHYNANVLFYFYNEEAPAKGVTVSNISSGRCTVVINGDLNPIAQKKTISHETAHIFGIGHTGDPLYAPNMQAGIFTHNYTLLDGITIQAADKKSAGAGGSGEISAFMNSAGSPNTEGDHSAYVHASHEYISGYNPLLTVGIQCPSATACGDSLIITPGETITLTGNHNAPETTVGPGGDSESISTVWTITNIYTSEVIQVESSSISLENLIAGEYEITFGVSRDAEAQITPPLPIIVADNSTSTVDVTNADDRYTVFPNPSNGRITVSNSLGAIEGSNTSSVRILTTGGQQIFADVYYGMHTFDLDISHLPNGIYILFVGNGKGQETPIKIVKI